MTRNEAIRTLMITAICGSDLDCDGCPQDKDGSCDEYTKFQRIREQYCVRCGKTFFERQENRMCGDCRAARKKQVQRKAGRDEVH